MVPIVCVTPELLAMPMVLLMLPDRRMPKSFSVKAEPPLLKVSPLNSVPGVKVLLRMGPLVPTAPKLRESPASGGALPLGSQLPDVLQLASAPPPIQIGRAAEAS